MSGGLAATDADGRIVMFNRAAEAITGQHAALVRGQAAARGPAAAASSSGAPSPTWSRPAAAAA